MSKEKVQSSEWQKFCQAMQVFAGDLSIVNHPQEAKVPLFCPPYERGRYSLSTSCGLNEAQFRAKMQKMQKVVVSCMDKRFAHPVYNEMRGELEPAEVLFISFAGGPVQNQERRPAMETIASFLSQFKNVEEVDLVGHADICGAVKYFLDGQSLPDVLHVNSGDLQEQECMKRLIAAGCQPWQEYFPGKVSAYLAVIDETTETVSFQEINFSQQEPLLVEDINRIITT